MKKDDKRAGVWSSDLSGFSSGGDYAFGYVPFDRVGNQHRSAVALAQQAQDNTLAQMAQSQEYNKENMALQNQYAIEAENRANEYNSPAAQIARADAAGISPLAALGIAGNVQTVSSAPSSSTPGAPGASPGRPSDGGASLGDVARLAISGATGFANVEKSISSASLDVANADVAKATAEGIRIDNADKIWKRTLRPYIATKYKSEAEQLRIKAEFEEAVQSNRVSQFLKDYDIKVAIEDLYKEKTETEQTVQNLNEAKSATEATTQALNQAKVSEIVADTDYQETVNKYFKATGVTPNSSISGSIALGAYTLVSDIARMLNSEAPTKDGVLYVFKHLIGDGMNIEGCINALKYLYGDSPLFERHLPAIKNKIKDFWNTTPPASLPGLNASNYGKRRPGSRNIH